MTSYVYDPATGLHTETWTGTSRSAMTSDTLYGYDVFGHLASVTVAMQAGAAPAAPAVVYAPFDASGHAASDSAALPTTLYVYDAAGNLIQQLNPNNTETDTSFNLVADQQTVTNKVTGAASNLSSYVYRLDADGRKTSDTETRLNNDGSTFSTTQINWTYDSLSRLLSESYSDGTGSTDNYTDAYAYDLAGNRMSKMHTAAANQKIEYQYNADNQLPREQTDNYDPAVSSPVTTTTSLQYQNNNTYDANGSLIQTTNASNAVIVSYGYDVRNRILSGTVGGVTSAFTYDDDGNRISNTVSSGTPTTYMVDPNNPSGYPQVLEEHQGVNVTGYVIGLPGVIAQDVVVSGTGTVSDLIPDGHNSTRLVTNGTGGVVGEYDYDAFGTQLALASASKPWSTTAPTPYRYTGLRWDQNLQLSLTQTRPYQPLDGRFIQQDSYLPVPGDLQNTNLYVYVGDNPITGTDPSGNFTLAETDAAPSLGEFIEADAGVTSHTAWVQATAIITVLGIVTGGGLAWTQNGSPSTPLGYFLQVQTQLQQNPEATGLAYDQAVETATASGKYTKKQVQGMPVFWVFHDRTPGIYDNDSQAMAGVGTKGRAKAPDVLNYGGPGMSSINRPPALAWAKSAGKVAGTGQSLDEYPFASTVEGEPKPWLRVEPVDVSEQVTQRTDLRLFYGNQGFKPFTFLVVLVP